MMAENDPYAQYAKPVAQEPTLKERQTGVGIRKGEIGAAYDEATLEDRKRKAKADAIKAEAEATKAEAEAKQGPKKSATEVALEAKKTGAAQRAAVVRAQMLNNIQLYKRDIKGQPASRAFGYTEYFDKPMLGGKIPAIPTYENFTAANNAILPLIRPLVAQSAKEGDSDKEMQVFMSYIPEAGDSDQTIETKFAMLDILIAGMADGKPPSEVMRLGTKPRSISEVEADLLQMIDPTKTRGYRLPEETVGRIRELYSSGKLTPQAYADLVVTGAIEAGVQPDEAFKADALEKGRETVGNMEKGLVWGGFDYENVDDAARAGLSWPEAALSGAANLPMSAIKSFGETGKALTVDLPETVEYIGKLAGDALGITDGETVKALGEHYATQYGTQEGFLTALAERPFEVLSDASVVAGGLSKVGNLTKAAKLSEALDPVRLTGRIVSAPFKAIVGGTKLAGEGTAQVLGLTTGAGGDAVKEAVKAGREGGKQGAAFLKNMRGEGDSTAVLGQVRSAISDMRNRASEAYRSGMVDVTKDKTTLDFQPIYDRLSKLRERAFIGDKIKNPSAAAVYEKTKAIVDDWYSGDPAQFHTPEGMDALKQRLREVSNDFKTDNNRRAASIASGVYDEVKKAIAKQVPVYEKIMADYTKAMEELGEIESELSLKPNAPVGTSLRKLQSIMRNNANTNYGRRVDLGRKLEDAGASELFPSLSGQQLSSKMPRGLGQIAAGGGILSAVPTGGMSLVTLPMTSPRIVGEAAYGTGKALGAFDSSIGKALSGMRETAQPGIDVFNYLSEKYADNRLPIQSLMAGVQGIEAAQGNGAEMAPPQSLPQIYSQPAPTGTGGPVVDVATLEGLAPEDAVQVTGTRGPINLGTEGEYDPITDTFVLPDGSRVDASGQPVEGFKNGGQPKKKKKQTSWYDDMIMAASRRGNDLVAAAADLADKYGMTPAASAAWVASKMGRSPQEVAAIRRNLAGVGNFRNVVEAGARSNEARFRQQGGRGARSADMVSPPVRLADAAYRPQDIVQGARRAVPAAAQAAGQYFRNATPQSVMQDARRAGSMAVKAIAEDPYGVVFDSMLYASPTTALAASPFDFAAMRGASRELSPYTRDSREVARIKDMVDAASVLPLATPFVARRAVRGGSR